MLDQIDVHGHWQLSGLDMRSCHIKAKAMSLFLGPGNAAGGLIMSASHNPGGPKEDWGIKFNYSSGEPAPERITDAIFGYTQKITELKTADLPDIDLSELGTKSFGGFSVTPLSMD